MVGDFEFAALSATLLAVICWHATYLRTTGMSPNYGMLQQEATGRKLSAVRQLGVGKFYFLLHRCLCNGGLWMLCAAMYRVGRGIPACERYLSKHGATAAGLHPDQVARSREKQRSFVATDYLK